MALAVEWKPVSERGYREHAFEKAELTSLCGRTERKVRQLKLELGLPPVSSVEAKCATCEMCLTKRNEKTDDHQEA